MSDHLLMADIVEPDGLVESEPMLVVVEGETASLTFDDGRIVMVNRDELFEALSEQREARAA